MTQETPPRPGRRPHQWLALAVGVVYLLLGVSGFVRTGFDGSGETLMGVAVDGKDNAVRITIGAVGLILWSSARYARIYGWLLAVGFGVLLVSNLVMSSSSDAERLNINTGDHWLHAMSSLTGLVIALWPRREAPSLNPLKDSP